MNYGEIKTAVAGVAHRTDLTALMDTFLLQAESDIRSDVRMLANEATTTLTLTTRTVAQPAGFMGVRRMVLNQADNPRQLEFLPPERLYASNIYTESGDPSVYTIEGSNFIFAPAPSGSPEALLHYISAFDAFTADGDTNDLATDYPGAYIYGMLKYLAIHIQDTENASVWSDIYRSNVGRANKETRRARTGARMIRTGVPTP